MLMKFFTGILLLSIFTATSVQAQTTGVHVGPTAGMTLSVLDGQLNRTASFKPGFVGGAAVRWRPSVRVAVQAELVYAQQGVSNKLDFGPYPGESKVKLNYLNLPILLKIYAGNVVNFQFGPQFGLLLSGRRVGQSGYYSGSSGSGYVTEDIDVKGRYKGDFALCGGVGVDLANGFMASARINYGLSDIDNDVSTTSLRQALGIGGIHNRTIQFTVGYLLGAGNK